MSTLETERDARHQLERLYPIKETPSDPWGEITTLISPVLFLDILLLPQSLRDRSGPNGAMIEEARKRSSGKNQPVEFHQGDSCALPFPEATFDVTRKIRHFDSDRRPNGLAGQKLYGLFWDAGLTDLQVCAVVHMNCNYEEILTFLDIRERVEAAQNAGVISIDEGVAWLERLVHAGQAGRFFMSTNHYLVCGRKA